MLVVWSFSIALAQKEPIKFGEVDEKDVSTMTHEKFPNAEAVILCDYALLLFMATLH